MYGVEVHLEIGSILIYSSYIQYGTGEGAEVLSRA